MKQRKEGNIKPIKSSRKGAATKHSYGGVSRVGGNRPNAGQSMRKGGKGRRKG
jgi:hypothetical protein